MNVHQRMIWLLFLSLVLGACAKKEGERFEALEQTLKLQPFSGKGPALTVTGSFPINWNRTKKKHEIRYWTRATEQGRLGQLLVGYYSCGDCRKEGIRKLLMSTLQHEIEDQSDPLKWEIVQEVGPWKNGAVGFVLRTRDVVNEGHWYKFVVDFPVESRAGDAGFFLRCTGDVGLKLQEYWVELVENCFSLKLSVDTPKGEPKTDP